LNREGVLCYQNLDGLPENIDFKALLKKEVSVVRNAAAVSEGAVPAPAKAPLTMQVKLNVLTSLFAGKTAQDIIKESGVSAEEIELIKNEIESSMKTKWGFKD
ncbi:MAG: hypothetical protein JNL74_05305, partial [Fibrobacteres bacterium]|nr:hypothetical protein [Fibrobacterota bacterium]